MTVRLRGKGESDTAINLSCHYPTCHLVHTDSSSSTPPVGLGFAWVSKAEKLIIRSNLWPFGVVYTPIGVLLKWVTWQKADFRLRSLLGVKGFKWRCASLVPSARVTREVIMPLGYPAFLFKLRMFVCVDTVFTIIYDLFVKDKHWGVF